MMHSNIFSRCRIIYNKDILLNPFMVSELALRMSLISSGHCESMKAQVSSHDAGRTRKILNC